MSQPCTVEDCDLPVGDAFVCKRCAQIMRLDLYDIPGLSDELDVTIGRQVTFGEQIGGKSAESPMVINEQASNLRAQLRNILVGWCRLLSEETGRDLPNDNIPSMSRWLLHDVERLRQHEAGAEAASEFRAITRRVRYVIDAPPNRTTFAVGPCPELDDTGTPCVGEIRAFIPATLETTATMRCAVCGVVYEPWQWHRAGRRILQRKAAS